MKKFSLSTKHKVFPDAYEADGNAFPIYTDFRRILRILRLIADSEVLDKDRHVLMLRLFFKGDIPPDPQNALAWFINCGETREGSGERDFDFEHDAREIYTAFQHVYGIDLMNCDMHWWRFSMLLDGLFACDNALSNKVRLRHANDSTAKRKNDLQRAVRNAAIGQHVSRADAAIEQKIRDRLKAGKPINDLIGGDAHG
jgi:hypothetical protein